MLNAQILPTPCNLQGRARHPSLLRAGLALILLLGIVRSLAAAPDDPQGAQPKAKLATAPNDWPNLGRYRDANASLAAPAVGETRAVFMGDSITDAWPRVGLFFPGKPYVCRGIGGQTTPQMLVRFRLDVIALGPKVVVILAGTNDIAGNSGPYDPAFTRGNIESMVDLAQANGIQVVLASITPVFDYPWRRGLQPAEKIVALNSWIEEYAARSGCIYVDFFSPMADSRNGMKAEYSADGVHPNAAGYAVMEPLAEQAISEALKLR